MTRQSVIFKPTALKDPSTWEVPEPIIPGRCGMSVNEEKPQLTEQNSNLKTLQEDAPFEDRIKGLNDIDIHLKALTNLKLTLLDSYFVNKNKNLITYDVDANKSEGISNKNFHDTSEIKSHEVHLEEKERAASYEVTLSGSVRAQLEEPNQTLHVLQPFPITPHEGHITAQELLSIFAVSYALNVSHVGNPTQIAGEINGGIRNEIPTKWKITDYYNINKEVDHESKFYIHKSMDLSMKTQLKFRDHASPAASSSSSNDGDSEASSLKRTKRNGSDDEQREKNNSSSRKSREKKARVEKENEKRCWELEKEHESLSRESEELRQTIEQLQEYHSTLLKEVRQRLWSVF
uniref:BZIP domain-containing protein n=1 Tax=Homalodisca liturata TaxID=320908 RepID=A0A1B6J278_9HEMI